MKAFVIFPTICVFFLTMTLLMLVGQTKPKLKLLWSILVTVLFGGFMTWFSVDVFVFLYYSNFIGLLVCISCLTYLANRGFSKTLNNRVNWFRILGLRIMSIAVTVVIAGFLIFIAFLFNPMDPPINK